MDSSQARREADAIIPLTVFCGRCGRSIERIEDEHLNAAILWGVLANAAHRSDCPEAPLTERELARGYGVERRFLRS